MRHGGRVDQLVLYIGSAVPCAAEEEPREGARMTYWDFLLRQDDSTILASDAYGHDIGGGDGLEGIFYGKHNMSAPVRQHQASSLSCMTPCFSVCPHRSLGEAGREGLAQIDHTDLVESSLFREDGDVPVDAGAYSRVWCQSRRNQGGGRGIGCS